MKVDAAENEHVSCVGSVGSVVGVGVSVGFGFGVAVPVSDPGAVLTSTSTAAVRLGGKVRVVELPGSGHAAGKDLEGVHGAPGRGGSLEVVGAKLGHVEEVFEARGALEVGLPVQVCRAERVWGACHTGRSPTNE